MKTIAITDTITGETQIAKCWPLLGLFDAHVDDYEFDRDPIRYREDRDYREGKLFNH